MPLFIRVTLIVAAGLAALVLLGFLLKLLVIAAVIAAVVVGVMIVARAFGVQFGSTGIAVRR